jgi:hypothetical protein
MLRLSVLDTRRRKNGVGVAALGDEHRYENADVNTYNCLKQNILLLLGRVLLVV